MEEARAAREVLDGMGVQQRFDSSAPVEISFLSPEELEAASRNLTLVNRMLADRIEDDPSSSDSATSRSDVGGGGGGGGPDVAVPGMQADRATCGTANVAEALFIEAPRPSPGLTPADNLSAACRSVASMCVPPPCAAGQAWPQAQARPPAPGVEAWVGEPSFPPACDWMDQMLRSELPVREGMDL